MKTTIHLEGFLDLVLQRAVDIGLARSKTDALRIGVLELNHNYGLVDDLHSDLAVKKMRQLDDETKQGKRKLLSMDEVNKKYGFLKASDK